MLGIVLLLKYFRGYEQSMKIIYLKIFCNEINSDKNFPDCSILVCYTIFVYNWVVSILDFGPHVIIMRPTHPCDIPIANYKIALIYRVNYEHWWKLHTYVMQATHQSFL